MLYERLYNKTARFGRRNRKNVWEDEVSRHIEIELLRKEHRCPCCGERTDKVHDYRKQGIKD